MSMVPEPERKGTLCCNFPAYRQMVHLHDGGEVSVVGHVGICGKCLKPINSFVPLKRDGEFWGYKARTCPSELDATAWIRLQRWSSEYGRYNCKFNELGVIVPWGWTKDTRHDFKRAGAVDDVPF